MDTLIALSNNTLNALEVWTLGGPISRRPRTVLLTSENNGVLSFLHVSLSGVPDGELLLRRDMNGLRAHLVVKLVDQACVSEGTSGHDLKVTSSRTVGVKVLDFDTALSQISRCGGAACDLARRRDVISGD